jgi:hypothetical protein
MRSCWLLSALIACADNGGEHSGVAVGNPGTLKLEMARIADDLVTKGGWMSNPTVDIADCEDGLTSEQAPKGYDMVDEPYIFAVPGGPLCAVTLTFADTIAIAGVGPDGWHVNFYLDLGPIPVEGPGYEVDGEALIFELGPPFFTTVDELGVGKGMTGDQTIEEGTPLYDEVVTAIETESALYVDRDQDGTLDPEEAEAGPIAGGPARDDVLSDEDIRARIDAGCGGDDAFVFLPFALLGLRRRFLSWRARS